MILWITMIKREEINSTTTLTSLLIQRKRRRGEMRKRDKQAKLFTQNFSGQRLSPLKYKYQNKVHNTIPGSSNIYLDSDLKCFSFNWTVAANKLILLQQTSTIDSYSNFYSSSEQTTFFKILTTLSIYCFGGKRSVWY